MVYLKQGNLFKLCYIPLVSDEHDDMYVCILYCASCVCSQVGVPRQTAHVFAACKNQQDHKTWTDEPFPTIVLIQRSSS
jgi:hypothetical protein